jgi:hypothetical protein
MTTQEEVRAELIEIAREYFRWKATLPREMYQACDDKTMAGILHDNRRSYTAPSSLAATPDAPPPEPRSLGSGEPRSLRVPGVALVDQLCDAADARDKAERVAEIISRLRK